MSHLRHLLIQIFNLHFFQIPHCNRLTENGGLVAWLSRCPNLPEMSLDCFWVFKTALASKSFWASFAVRCDPYGGYEQTKACAALRRGFFPVREVEHELTSSSSWYEKRWWRRWVRALMCTQSLHGLMVLVLDGGSDGRFCSSLSRNAWRIMRLHCSIAV